MWPFRRDRGQAKRDLGSARRAMARGQWERAAEILRQLLEADPSRADIRLNLGVALYSMGLFSEAMAEFERVVAQDPDMAAAWANLGAAANQLGHIQRAEEALSRAAQLDPTLRDVHLNMALLRLKQGRLAEALAELESELANHPDNQAARALATALERELFRHR